MLHAVVMTKVAALAISFLELRVSIPNTLGTDEGLDYAFVRLTAICRWSQDVKELAGRTLSGPYCGPFSLSVRLQSQNNRACEKVQVKRLVRRSLSCFVFMLPELF